jgi:hypothetical protein
MKKKLLKVLGITVLWSLIYWGVASCTDSSWLNLAVFGAFISSVFVTAFED